MSTEIVPFDNNEGPPSATLPANPWDVSQKLTTTFPMDDPVSLALVARGILQPDGKLKRLVNQVIDVIGFTFHLRRISASDEAPRDGLYIVVHCADGKNWETVSGGVLQSLPLLYAQWGRPPWDKGKKARVISKETGSGYELVLLVSEEPLPKKGKQQS